MAMTRALFAALCVTIAACNSSSFEGSNDKKTPPAPTPPAPKSGDNTVTPPVVNEQTETFSIAQNQGMIDVVWVIDNSGSMTEEAQQVRNNFQTFVNSVQSRSDMHVALLSKSAGSNSSSMSSASTGVTLPSTALAAGGRQVDAWVGSFDPLALLAASICAAGTTTLPASSDDAFITLADERLVAGGTICGQAINIDPFEMELAPAAFGKLHDFFRPQAKKVFVIVSDDNAQAVTAANFVSLVKPDLGGQTPTIFGFVGISENSSCSISNVGDDYKALASQTGGAVFDMCAVDWSANFSKLGDNLAALAQSQFTVKATSVASVTSVSVDGKPLAMSAVKVSGSVVTVDPTAMPPGAKMLTVTYKKGA